MTDTVINDPTADQGPFRMPDQGAPSALRGSNPALDVAHKIEGLQAQDDAAFAGEQKALAGPRARLSQTLNTPAPAPPTQQQLGPAPDQKDFQKDAMAFASAMAVLGAVAGKFARVPGTAALSAFAGALKGWQTGNLQAYENATKQWEENTKATIDNNKMVMDKYRLELENRKNNIDQQMSNIQMIAAQYHDKMMYDAAAAKNYTLVAGIYEKNAEFTGKLEQSSAVLSEKLKQDRLKAEQSATYWLSPEGQERFQTLPPTQQAAIKQMIDIYASKAVKGGEVGQLVAKENQERAARGEPPMTAQEEIEFNQKARPPRSASAMSVEAFKREFREKNGRDPTGTEIQDFNARQAEVSSAARTKGGREANLDIILRVTDSAIPAALAASDKVPRGSWVPLNQIIQKGQVVTSNTDLMQFGMANLQLAEGWARAMNPTGVMRESDRDKALSFLSTATSPETYKALVEQLRTQIQRERAAIESGKTSAISAPGETPSVSESTGAGWTDLGGGVRIREKP